MVTSCLLSGFKITERLLTLLLFPLASFLRNLLQTLAFSLVLVVFSLFFLVPVLDVLEHLLEINMRHVVVLRKLGGEVRFAGTRLAGDESLERLQATDFTELFLYELNVL